MFKLQQISLALHTYESKYSAFPPAYTVDATGKPLHSWRTLILPSLDHEDLHDAIDLTKPWDDPANAKVCESTLEEYCCPETYPPSNTTSYLASVAPGGFFLPDKPRKLVEITDGISRTLMVIEAPSDRAVPWMSPRDAGEALVMGINAESNLDHSIDMNALFVDGSVRFLRAGLGAAVRRALISVAGNDGPSASDY